MKLDLRFEENQQNINVQFSEDEEQINTNFGEISVIHGGQDGATFIPSVSDDGIISWTNDRDLPNPKPVNIKGEKGDSGVTSWNDLEDKPFGEAYDWVTKIDETFPPNNIINQSGFYSVNIPRPNGFKFVAGEKYKIVAKLGLFIKECEYVATSKNYVTYVGTTDDDMYLMDFSPLGGITLYYKTSFPESSVKITVYAYSATIKTLDEKYLPDSVVLESELDAKGYQTEEQVKALIDDSITGSDSTFEMPIFNLAEMGMSTHTVGGETTDLFADVSHIIEAMRKGFVGFIIPTNFGNVTVYSPTMEARGMPEAVCAFWLATGVGVLWGDVAIACTSNNLIRVASMFRTTEEQVTELINNALGGIENGTY